MSVDVTTSIVIDRPIDIVASFAVEPSNATAWYANIRSASLLGGGELREGARIAFEARFLGRDLRYTYEVRRWAPGETFVMATADGPFRMETSYTWESMAPGRTRMLLRNRGEPSGFSRLVLPLMARAMRSANRKDLARLKGLLESGRS